MNLVQSFIITTLMALLAVFGTLLIVEPGAFKSGHAAAMAEVDAIVQPIGWETIRKTKEACEAKWQTECVITGGYMPKTDVQP